MRPSPLLPESDEDLGVGSAPPGGGRGSTASGQGTGEPAGDQAAPRTPRAPVTVQIDFDGLPQRIVSVPGVPERQYSQLKAGAPGAVYYLEAGAGGGRGGPGGGATLHRYRLSDRRAAVFATGVAQYDVSADGRKLLYRTGGGAGGRGGACGPRGQPVPGRCRSHAALGGAGPARRVAADVSRAARGVQADLC